MKKHPTFLLFCSITLAITLFSIESNAQLSGNYTIDPTQSASNTNYTSFGAAIGDLTGGTRSDSGTPQGPGVNGKVTISVYDTIYRNTRISIGAISGTSSTNTVTFESAGADSSKCLIRRASSTATLNDYVLQLNGCDFVTFKSIGFERTGNNNNSTVIRITNNSDNCSFTNCKIMGRKVPSNSSNGFVYGIGSLIYFTGNGDNTKITNNKLIYGYNGVYSTSLSSNTEISGNVLDTIGSSGIYMSGQTGLKIQNNQFNMGDFGPSKGHYVSYGIRIESTTRLEFTGNKMNMMAVNGQVVRAIMLANLTGNTQSSRTLVANNFVTMSGGTGNCTGLALYNCEWVDMYSNNIHITSSLKGGACFYIYPQYTNAQLRLVNNVLVNTGGGFVYSVDGTNTGNISSLRNNAVYHTGSYLGQWSGNDYGTWAQWLTGSRKDTASVYGDPGFVSSTDLHVSNIAINGKALPNSSITTDIDGDSRSTTTPDIGADEFFPANVDIGISKLDSPAAFCAGKYDVKVSFQNYGVDTIKSATLNWSVNGNSQTAYSWTGTLAPGANASGIKIGSFTFSANTPYSFKIWTSAPNSKSDGKNINDTLSITKLTGLTGAYTIGSSQTASFKSFNEAITAITARGLCGATTFNVEDGTYNEQITLIQLDGMGASAPLTFQGISKDSSKIIITLPSTTATGNNNAACQLRGADYVTFKWMTFERTGRNPFAQVIHILDGAHNNTFTNCQMLATRVSTNNADGVNIWSDVGRDTNNVFTNNYISKGTHNILYAGVGFNHESGTVISNNIFDSAFMNAIYLQRNDSAEISNNIFRFSAGTSTGNAVINLLDCDGPVKITANRLRDRWAEKGIIMSDCNASLKSPAIIANNMITRNEGYGVEFNASSHQLFAFNSIYFWGDDTGNAAISTTNSQNSNIYLYNNNIMMDSGQVYNIWLKSHIAASSHNNLYTQSPRPIRFNNNWFKSINGFNKQTGLDSNSLSVNPYFIERYDLHAKNTALNGAGIPVNGITTDFDSDIRNSTLPDIGADEFDPEPNDAGVVTFSSPSGAACEGKIDINVVIKNFGKDELKNVTINWTRNDTLQTAYSWTGNLTSQATDTIKLGSGSYKSGQSLKLSGWTTNPNGQTDGFVPNDSIGEGKGFVGLPIANAGKDKTLCSGDSIRIGTNGSSNYAYSWLDFNNNEVAKGDRIWVKPTSTTTYTLMVVDKTRGCINYDDVIVNVGTLPTLNIVSDQTICQGQSVALGGSAQSGNTYSWTSNPTGFTSNVNNPVVKPNITTTYTLEQTIDSTGCTAYKDIVLTVNPSPNAELVGDTSICNGDSEVFSVTANSGNTYSWSFSNGSVTSGGGTTDNSITLEFNNSGASSVQVIEINSFGCSDTSSFAFNVNDNPIADFSYDNNCLNREIQFLDESTGNNKRSWDFGDGTTKGGKRPTHTYSNTGDYTIVISATSEQGCIDTETKTINIVDAPRAGFVIDDNACQNQELDINNTSTGSGVYTWNFGDGNTSTDQNPTHTIASSGNFTVKLVMNNNGCKDSISTDITVNPAPESAFSLNVDGDEVNVTATNTDGDSYEWDFGDGNSATGTSANHEYDITEGWVKVTLTVTSAAGCTSSTVDSAYIDVSSIGELPSYVGQLSVYPNPSFGNAIIEFDLDKTSDISIALFDLQGREINSIYNGELMQGQNKVEITNLKRQLQTGTYMLRINFDNEATVAKMIQLR
ncbi:MAG: PKD domain-containing protein [Bacteroidia bacterium]